MKEYCQANPLLGELGMIPQHSCEDFEIEYGEGFEPDG
jgi:hypothetical protein